jgi:hypothetical protein
MDPQEVTVDQLAREYDTVPMDPQEVTVDQLAREYDTVPMEPQEVTVDQLARDQSIPVPASLSASLSYKPPPSVIHTDLTFP